MQELVKLSLISGSRSTAGPNEHVAVRTVHDVTDITPCYTAPAAARCTQLRLNAQIPVATQLGIWQRRVRDDYSVYISVVFWGFVTVCGARATRECTAPSSPPRPHRETRCRCQLCKTMLTCHFSKTQHRDNYRSQLRIRGIRRFECFCTQFHDKRPTVT